MFLEHVLLTTGLNLNGRIHSSIFYIAYPLQGCGWTGAYFSWLLARGGADPEMVVCQYNRLILCVIIFFAPMKHMTITDHLTNLHSSIFLKDIKKRKPKAHTKKYRVVFLNYYLWILSRSAYFYPRLGSLFCRSKLGWWLDLGRVKMVTTTRFFGGGCVTKCLPNVLVENTADSLRLWFKSPSTQMVISWVFTVYTTCWFPAIAGRKPGLKIRCVASGVKIVPNISLTHCDQPWPGKVASFSKTLGVKLF